MTFFSPLSISIRVFGCCAALACSQAYGSGALSGPTLADLAPVRLYAVPEITVAPPVPLPDPLEASADPYDGDVSVDSDIPDISFDFFWQETDFREWHRMKVSSSSPGLRGTRGWRRPAGSRSRWLSTPSQDPWTLGSSNWRYAGEQGLGITLGSNEIAVPAWGSSTRMGGISISQSSVADTGDSGAWRYSMAVGALDYSASQEQGDLNYGPTASNTVLSYQMSPQFVLESQLEVAPDLLTTGIGGRYKTRGWGAWSAGVARASAGMQTGWRYQAAYEVDVLEDLKLSWVNESHSAGFADLSRYQDISTSVGGIRQRVTATVPMGRWGDLGGMYESSRSSVGDIQRSFGLTQQFWYSPNLRIGLQAERQLVTGDYDVGIRFSVPIN